MIAKPVNDAVEFGDALTAGGAALIGIRFRIRNKGRHPAVLCAADADAPGSARVIPITLDALRFRIDDEHRVVLVDEDAARPAELLPLIEELPILIEDLDPIVGTIGHEDPAL